MSKILFNSLINGRASNMLKLVQVALEKLYIIVTTSHFSSDKPVTNARSYISLGATIFFSAVEYFTTPHCNLIINF